MDNQKIKLTIKFETTIYLTILNMMKIINHLPFSAVISMNGQKIDSLTIDKSCLTKVLL
jgi:hypothetical protein